jgi:hypothetical protein
LRKEKKSRGIIIRPGKGRKSKDCMDEERGWREREEMKVKERVSKRQEKEMKKVKGTRERDRER